MWACTRPLQSVHAAAELVCRGRVVVLVSYVMSTAAVRRVVIYYLVDYCIIVLHINPNPSRHHRKLRNISDLNLCLQPLACVILKLGMIKAAVSNWGSKKYVMKLLRFESHPIMFFFAFDEKSPFLNLKKSCIIRPFRPLFMGAESCEKSESFVHGSGGIRRRVG